MRLGDQGFAEMFRNGTGFWEINAVATHFCDHVFSKQNDFSGAKLNSTRIGGENGSRNTFAQIFRYEVRNCRSWINVSESGISGSGNENKP